MVTVTVITNLYRVKKKIKQLLVLSVLVHVMLNVVKNKDFTSKQNIAQKTIRYTSCGTTHTCEAQPAVDSIMFRVFTY